jgi:hypothetical protein
MGAITWTSVMSTTTIPMGPGAGGAAATSPGGGSGGNAGLVILGYTAATCSM